MKITHYDTDSARIVEIRSAYLTPEPRRDFWIAGDFNQWELFKNQAYHFKHVAVQGLNGFQKVIVEVGLDCQRLTFKVFDATFDRWVEPFDYLTDGEFYEGCEKYFAHNQNGTMDISYIFDNPKF